MRHRPIYPYLDVTVGALGLPHGSHKWVLGGTGVLLVPLALFFPDARLCYFPVWLLVSGGWLLGSAFFFLWARLRRTPRWLENRCKWWWIGRDAFRGYRPGDFHLSWILEEPHDES